MKTKHLLTSAMLFLAGIQMTDAALSDNLLQRPEAYVAESSKLRNEPPKNYEFNRAVLSDVLRFLAEDAGLNYIALPEDEATTSTLVTFNVTASPFAALEMVADTHGVAMLFENQIWHMRPIDDQQLIARAYEIRFNPGEVVEAGSAGSGGSFSGGGGGGGGLGQPGGGGGGGLSLNKLGNSFKVSSDEMIKNIEKILGVRTRGFDANIAAATQVGGGNPLTLSVAPGSLSNGGNDGAAEAQVLWNSDTNTLFVVASRQQHQYVQAYLESIDKPQDLIAIEVKFFESGKDPRKEFGIDWSDAIFNKRFSLTPIPGVAERDTVREGGPTGPFESDTEIDPTTGLEIPGGTGPNTLLPNGPNDFVRSVFYPQAAILDAPAVSVGLNALLQDSDTHTVSYPRMLTRNNREVVIQSVVNEPVLSAESSTSQSAGGVATVSVDYLPIGTTVNVLPKIMPDGTINLNLAVTVSSIIGNVVINGNPYPKASSRVYTAPLKLKSGLTAAIAGLDEADDAEAYAGVPFLSKIPILGKAFKDNSKSRSRRKLMIWVTPYVLNVDGEGIGEEPVAELPITKHDPLREAPQIYGNGELVGGIDALKDAILWADREGRRLKRNADDRRIDKKFNEETASLAEVCASLNTWIASVKPSYPSRDEELSVHQWSLDRISKKIEETQEFATTNSDFN
ncbi:hypothetical protein OAF27_00450 [Verrucomicrobiales bacterium]|nr:hypothetical protein [Verrucomicrobiales bacterium]